MSQPEKKSSSSPQLRKCESKKSIKLTEFDGSTPWPMFSLLFENCSRINGWDESERLIHLQLALQGAAQQMMWTDGRADWTSADLLAELAERFSPESQADQYRALLSTRRRHKGETISDLGQDIQRLAALAFPGPRDQTKEMFAIDAFLRAVSNKDLGFHMKRTASVKTLTEAIRYAQQYEAFHRDSDEDEPMYNTVRKEKKTRIAATAEDKEVRSIRETELEKEVRQLQEKLKTQLQQATQSELELTKKIAEVTTRDGQQFNRNRDSPRGRGRSQRRNGDGGMDSVSILCFNCGGPGHISRNCQKGRWNNSGAAKNYSNSRGGFQNRGATGNRNSATGYNSNNYGNSGSQNSATANESKNFSATGNLVKKDSATESESVKATTAGGQSTYWTRPVMLEVKMNGSRRFCLIDTGCHTTMIPPSCAKGLRLKKTDSTYTNASDDVMKISGVATVRIRLNDKILDIDAVVSPDCSEPMLGYDWLQRYRVHVLVHEGVVSIDGTKYQLQPRNRDPESCNVVAKESRTIPPHSAVILGSSLRICNVMERTPQPHMSDWMVEPYEIRQGVFVGRTLLPRQSDDLPVSVINTTDSPVEIEQDAVLTEAVPVDVPGATEAKKRRKPRNFDHIKPLLEGVSQDMSNKEKGQLWELLKEYADVFSSGKMDMGRTNLVSHQIDTGEAQPKKQQLRKQAWAHQDIIATERQELSEADLITEFNGPWCSNVVIVTKKDGTARFCIDYRKLNEVTRKDAYPLPSIEVCLDALAGSKYFSTFDLRSGYHQIPMHPDSIAKTAFVTREGTFAFKVMPFGLCNAGATFQRLMDLLMVGLTYKICLVYLDDIIVFSRDMKQHLERCRVVFSRLRSAGLKLKVSKCNMMRDSVQFLGHVVSGSGVATDPEKISKVKEWPQPKDIHDVKAFYGLCSYYRKFVKDFAKIAAPLTALMRAENKFVWDGGCEASFRELKRKLTTSPVLALPQPDGRFVLDTDASNFAIGGVLSQVQGGLERVIAYGSRSLTKEEKNYCVTRRELLAITEFLKKYRQYILGRRFTIRTDHAALTWMRRTPEPIGQQARWISLVDEYDFDIEYRAGKQHGNADALSRMPCVPECKQCTGKGKSSKVAAIRERPGVQKQSQLNYSDEDVAAATDGDVSLCHVKQWLRLGSQPEWDKYPQPQSRSQDSC